MSKKRAFARYTKRGQLVPGSLVVTTKGGYPDKTSLWGEVPVDLFQPNSCSTPDYGAWRLVTGGEAGDGVVVVDSLIDNEFTFIGPNDDDNDGWVYLTRYFAEDTLLSVGYNWTSFDDEGGSIPSVDWPVYWISATEPTGIPEDLTVRVNDTPSSGTWFVTVPAGTWFGVGIYSDDSCCGRGFLSINVNASPLSYFTYLITTLPEDYADATGNTPGNPSIGPDGNIYYAFDGFVFDSAGGATSTPLTNAPVCATYSPYVFYFKNNSYVLINRPGTVVSTETICA